LNGWDWQTLIALACLALAAGWWLRRACRWASNTKAGCASGCGHCAAPKADNAPMVSTDELMRFDSPRKIPPH
jgi:hypothetical protein